jgi:pimeloyl-ACP methyl ester carboxylesterase
MTGGLLLLHAFPVDASMWSAQVDDLSRSATVLAPNFPGFGGAPLAGPVMTMDQAADAAAEACAATGIDRAVVCGLSMGGYVALALWRRHRSLVAGLVLANTRAGADDDAARDRRRALAERLRAEGNAFIADDPPPLLSAGAPGELWQRIKDMIRSQPAEAIAAASLGMAERADSTGDLAAIDVPTMVITSTGDTLIPPAATSPMAPQIPGARLEVIEGAGHLSNLEAPEAFNRLLLEHLAASGIRP